VNKVGFHGVGGSLSTYLLLGCIECLLKHVVLCSIHSIFQQRLSLCFKKFVEGTTPIVRRLLGKNPIFCALFYKVYPGLPRPIPGTGVKIIKETFEGKIDSSKTHLFTYHLPFFHLTLDFPRILKFYALSLLS